MKLCDTEQLAEDIYLSESIFLTGPVPNILRPKALISRFPKKDNVLNKQTKKQKVADKYYRILRVQSSCKLGILMARNMAKEKWEILWADIMGWETEMDVVSG